MKVLTLIVSIGLAFCMAPGSFARSECKVEFSSPAPGEKVGPQGIARGTASQLPPGSSLWIFAHLDGLRGWWPQGGGPADINRGQWKVLVNYGMDRDRNMDFEIATAVVGQDTNLRLLRWVEDGNRTNSYPPIDFPSTIEACGAPVRIVVTKIN